MSWIAKVLDRLSAQGHRVTGPRRTILERIADYQHPFSAEQLFKDLGGEAGSIGRATIYRTVDLLLDDHWLARVHWSPSREAPGAAEHAYVPIEQGHQHHMVCQGCGAGWRGGLTFAWMATGWRSTGCARSASGRARSGLEPDLEQLRP